VRDKDVTSGENDDQAAWLDLIAHYDAPADLGGGTPWPERENLTEPDNAPISGASQVTRSPQAPESPQATGPFPVSDIPPGIRPAAPADPRPGPDQPPGSGGRQDPGGRPGAGPAGSGGLNGSPAGTGGPHAPGQGDGPGATGPAGTRSLRGGQHRPARPAPDSQEEHYFPPPPPPLPRLDPLSKGAWAALFGGPAYLLIATAVGWAVPAVAAFFAIGAFVAGFAILVLRMGDDRGGSGPDDGAAV